MLRSVLLFIPHDPEMRKWMVTCWGYCMRRGLQPTAVVHQWCDVLKMMADGVASKVVVARRDHADWLEVVSEEPESGEPRPSRRTGRM